MTYRDKKTDNAQRDRVTLLIHNNCCIEPIFDVWV